jgi:hypothetical protein
MKTIIGIWATRNVVIDGEFLSPIPSQKIINHSPDGFNWGYVGSGPAQLALALLLKFTTKAEAQRLYQDFKRDVIAGLPQADFQLPVEVVHNWLKAQS